MLANAVKSLPPSPKVGATGAPQYGLACDIFKTFTFCGGHCAVVRCASGTETILFCTRGCPLADDVLSLGPTPKILPPGASGPPTPKNVFPQFLKNFRGQGQNVECAVRGPPRVVCGENLVTVPRSISPEKNCKISPKIVNFSSYANFRTFKKIECMRRGPPYDTAKGHRRRLSPRDFKSKKLEIPLAPMVNRKTLERSRLQSTPPHNDAKKLSHWPPQVKNMPLFSSTTNFPNFVSQSDSAVSL